MATSSAADGSLHPQTSQQQHVASSGRTTAAGPSKNNSNSNSSAGVVRNAEEHGTQVDADEGDRDTAYFQYYALLSHQAQMLQDAVRTSAYQKAILSHSEQCFNNKTVIDVGAGNGILSIFAAQAGARRVYAIEASNMVEHLQHFVRASNSKGNGTLFSASGALGANKDGQSPNPWLGNRVLPVSSKMEDVTPATLEGTTQVDTVISECLGVLLVHERMCESFLDARDRFLKPGGAVLPSSGTICLAPIEDKVVWEEAANKARFWDNRNFYGVDVTPFSEAAWEESFSSPVVGCFGPLIVLAPSNDYNVDFQTISKEQLKRFTIPLSFEMTQTAVVHGLAGWFDLHFLPPSTGSDGESTVPDLEMSMAPSGSGQEQQAASTAATLDPSAAGFTGATFDINSLSNLLGVSSSSNTMLPDGSTQADPSISSTYMTTSPFASPTHWQQVRFLFREPLAVNKGQRIVGSMLCEVNQYRSYTLTTSLHIEGSTDALMSRHSQWRLDRQVYSWTSAAPAPQ